jgi:hypothetical protein
MWRVTSTYANARPFKFVNYVRSGSAATIIWIACGHICDAPGMAKSSADIINEVDLTL